MKRAFLLLVFLISCCSLHAQTPILAADVWNGVTSANPGKLTVFNGKLYFIARDSAHGYEPWSFDQSLTAAIVADVYPGATDGAETGNNIDREPMAVLNGKLYFSGRSASNAPKLFAYNGVNPPAAVITYTYKPSKASFMSLTTVGNKLFYISDTSSGYSEGGSLYSYDPVNGQVRHRKLGISSLMGAYLPNLLAYNGKLYFGADSTGLGNELFVHDPATGKTSLVADIATGSSSGKPERFAVGGGKLYFTASDAAHGNELYSYDGTAVQRLTDLTPGTGSGMQFAATANTAYYKGGIFFNGAVVAGQSALYRFDVATGTTAMIYDFNPAGIDRITTLYPAGNDLYFFAFTTATGLELWKYNGTICSMVADINPGPADGAGLNGNFAHLGTALYFNGITNSVGSELYRITGLPAASAAIQSVAWNGELAIHPNPAVSSVTMEITLKNAESLQVSLTDITGRQVFISRLQTLPAGKNALNIPVQSLAAGQYFYHLSNDKGQGLASGALVRQ